MRLKSSDLLFGINAKDLRDFFKRFNDNFSDKSFCDRLNIEPSEVDKIYLRFNVIKSNSQF